MEPVIDLWDPIYAYFSVDSEPNCDGILPVRLVNDSERYVIELQPPILVGIEPRMEDMDTNEKYFSFDS